MKREDVYKLIDGERAYQNTDPHDAGHEDANRSIADWIIFIEEQVLRAKLNVYNLKYIDALSSVRKIAALAVACMEYNKTNSRK